MVTETMNGPFLNENDLKILPDYGMIRLISTPMSECSSCEPGRLYGDWARRNQGKHQHREAMLALDGVGRMTLNGSCYSYRAGDLILVDRNETHDSQFSPFHGNVRQIWFRVVNRTILTSGACQVNHGGELIRGKHGNYIFNQNNPAGQLFINAWDRLIKNRTASLDQLAIAIKHAMVGLLLELNEAEERQGCEKSHQHRSVIVAIMAHIQETSGKHLDLDTLSRLSGYSKFHFARLFKEISGVTVLDFINTCRVETYKRRIAEGYSKKQISDELGFSHPAAFSRWLSKNSQVVKMK